MVRFNNWEPDASWYWPYVDSGGYAMTAAMNVAQSGVVAVIGEYFSKTAIFTAEVPICGSSASSSKLSNKQLYPYFFRMTSGTSLLAKGYATLLQAWNVKRVALVVGFDTLGLDTARHVQEYFDQAGIRIITKVSLTPSMAESHDYLQAYLTLLAVDARYIFIAADSVTITDFYYRNHSLISPRHVWLSNNGLKNNAAVTKAILERQTVDITLGFITFSPDFPSYTADPLEKFYNLLYAEASMDESPEMLANGSLTSNLLPSIFANTGYHGLAHDPLTFDENGDLELPLLFATWNISFIVNIKYVGVDKATAFGGVDAAANVYTPSSIPPVFFGGSSIPPPDGPILEEMVIQWSSPYGIVLAFLSALGMLLSCILAASLSFLGSSRVIKSMSLIFTRVYTLGALIANMSLLFFIGPVTNTTCTLRMWIPFISVPLTLGCSVVKNARVYAIFKLSKRGKIKKNLMRYIKDDMIGLAVGVLTLIACIILGIWQSSEQHDGFYITGDKSKSLHVCLEPSTSGSPVAFKATTAMIIFTALLLASTGILSYVTSSIFDSVSEASFLSISFMFGTVGFAVTIATIFRTEPSAAAIFIRNIFTWGVVNLCLLTLYIPKMVEAFADLHEQKDNFEGIGHLPSASLLGEDSQSSTKTDAKEVKSVLKIPEEQVEYHRNITHINLRGGFLKRQVGFGKWSKWAQCGISIFKSEEKKWIVFESDTLSAAWPLNESSQAVSYGQFLLILLSRSDGERGRVWMEFESPERLKEFIENFNLFLSQSV
ncbi:hypothetical protein HDU76_003658 [Blyttiomyces sp. JEL0837]|nr:hypothetical protein HDU76_003658 [Blyttiomyces sp. JEL0837]